MKCKLQHVTCDLAFCLKNLLISLLCIANHGKCEWSYCTAGKFGSDNVWQKWMDKDYGKKNHVNS